MGWGWTRSPVRWFVFNPSYLLSLEFLLPYDVHCAVIELWNAIIGMKKKTNGFRTNGISHLRRSSSILWMAMKFQPITTRIRNAIQIRRYQRSSLSNTPTLYPMLSPKQRHFWKRSFQAARLPKNILEGNNVRFNETRSWRTGNRWSFW